jgi:hypothetical protein
MIIIFKKLKFQLPTLLVFFILISLKADPLNLSGIIKNELSVPVPSATVTLVKNSTIRSVTSASGAFSLIGSTGISDYSITPSILPFQSFIKNNVITLSLPFNEHVSIHIYNVQGEKIRTLFDNILKSGESTIPLWVKGINTNNVYFVRIKAGNVTNEYKLLNVESNTGFIRSVSAANQKGALPKIQAGALDTIKVTATGYATRRVPITSFTCSNLKIITTKYVCPEWIIEEAPSWSLPYVGDAGYQKLYPTAPVFVNGTKNIDYWQAGNYLVYRTAIDSQLYKTYTPLTVNYIKGTLPIYEQLAAKYIVGLTSDSAKAIALLKKALPSMILTPMAVPLSKSVLPGDRGLLDEPLLKSGTGWCNEVARAFVRLCQVSGIPARLIFLWYDGGSNGHVVAEYYANGAWHMAEPSWCTVFPDASKKLMNAVQCHLNKPAVEAAYIARWRELLTYTDIQLVGNKFAGTTPTQSQITSSANDARVRLNQLINSGARSLGSALWVFGILNYPVPQ